MASCLAALGCGHGMGPLERSMDRMEGQATFEQTMDRFGLPFKQERRSGFLVAHWGLEPRVGSGSQCPHDEYCVQCWVSWQDYTFYFRESGEVLDHWQSHFPWFIHQPWGEISLPPGTTYDQCQKDRDCLRRLDEQCKDKISNPPASMPASSPYQPRATSFGTLLPRAIFD